MVSVDVLSVAIRALSFVALFQATGLALFYVLLGHLYPASQPNLIHIGVRSALTGIVLVLGHQLLAGARMAGEFTGMTDLSMQLIGLQSSSGVANMIRIAGLIVIAVAMRREHVVWKSAGVLLVVLSFIYTGHTSNNADHWLLAPVLMLHLLAGIFWFGGFMPLYLVSQNTSGRGLSALIGAFSAIAVWLVPSMALAGVVMAIVLLPDANSFQTTYGRLLLLKVTVFALLMGLATLNKWRFSPGIARGEWHAVRAFRLSVSVEYVLIVCVLILTAVMTGLFSPEG